MLDLDALCHTCGAPLAEPSTARHPQCAACRSDRPAARKRLARRARANRLRAYARGLPGQFSAADVRAIWRAQRQRCAYCGRGLGALYANPPGYHVDHVEALAGGGANEKSNLQLLCPTCNLKKGAS